MLVTPRPGVDRKYLLDTLRSVQGNVASLRGAGSSGSAHKRLLAYLEWANLAVRMLGNQISSGDLDRLVLTRRHELLLSGVGTMASPETGVQRVVNDLVALELDQRVEVFDAAIKALDAQITRWSSPLTLVVADSSFYVEHPQKLEAVDFAPLVGALQSDLHLMVPIVVVDELDGLKQSKDKHVRWRAGYTLAVLDRLFSNTTGPAKLRAGDAVIPGPDGTGRGQITIELLFDPPGHVRLPINDDEIIDRTLAVEALAAGQVTLLTYDTGQSTRARAAGLRVNKLTKEIGEEPK
jgi:hypothetical protein